MLPDTFTCFTLLSATQTAAVLTIALWGCGGGKKNKYADFKPPARLPPPPVQSSRRHKTKSERKTGATKAKTEEKSTAPEKAKKTETKKIKEKEKEKEKEKPKDKEADVVKPKSSGEQESKSKSKSTPAMPEAGKDAKDAKDKPKEKEDPKKAAKSIVNTIDGAKSAKPDDGYDNLDPNQQQEKDGELVPVVEEPVAENTQESSKQDESTPA